MDTNTNRQKHRIGIQAAGFPAVFLRPGIGSGAPKKFLGIGAKIQIFLDYEQTMNKFGFIACFFEIVYKLFTIVFMYFFGKIA